MKTGKRLNPRGHASLGDGITSIDAAIARDYPEGLVTFSSRSTHGYENEVPGKCSAGLRGELLMSDTLPASTTSALAWPTPAMACQR